MSVKRGEGDYILRVTFRDESEHKPLDMHFATLDEVGACVEGFTLGWRDGKDVYQLEMIEPKVTRIVTAGLPQENTQPQPQAGVGKE